MTEQFCKGDKYCHSKYTNLIDRSLETIKPRKQQRFIDKTQESPKIQRREVATKNLNKILNDEELSVGECEDPGFMDLIS